MILTLRVWSDEQLRAVQTYIEMYVLPDAELRDCPGGCGAKRGEHRGVRYLSWEPGTVEVLEDDTPDAAMTAVLEAYNAAYAEGFPV
jgi:hypothetical protein